MKAFWLILCILFSFHSFANNKKSYSFHYINKDIKLNPDSFRRYVRPQVKAIVSDFFFTLKKIRPIQGDLIEIMRAIFKLEKSWRAWAKDCQTVSPECKESLHKLYSSSRKVDEMILSFQKNKLNFQGLKKGHQFDSRISLSHSLDRIASLNYQILHLLEELQITNSTSFSLYSTSKKQISPLMHKMFLRSEMIITSQLDKSYRDDFEAVWNNFIKLLERHVLKERKIDYLLSNLEKLNTSWNSFHMKVSKTNRTLPEKPLKTIGFMHNRWNSILKVILRN